MPVTIPNGSKHMNVVTYTGNGTARTISGVGFQPDFVWIKNRSSGAFWHQLYDANRGALKGLFSNDTSAESTYTDTLTAFTSDGFSLGTDVTYNGGVNKSGDSYVAWCWKAGNSAGSSNTAGSITSTVSANPTAGFSVVTYTGNGTSGATVGHGLGVAPSMIIVKNRVSSTGAWMVAHSSLSSGYNLELDATIGQANTFSRGMVTTFNSTIFTLTAGSAGTSLFENVNQNTQTYVAYCWSEVAGYSKFGSYTGNGSSDGPFVYCGFRPKFLMWKRSDSTGDWIIFDTARDTFNYAEKQLVANTSGAEAVTGGGFVRIDMLSNGFKIRSTDSYVNANGGTYIFMAVAENPFKNSVAR